MSKEEYKDAIEVSVIFHKGQRMFAVPKQPAQSLPFGVGSGLVAIKTLLSRDPCVHANTAIQMIDAILAEQPAQQEPSPGGVLFAVEEAIRNGDCPWQIEQAFDEYEAERKAAHNIKENA